MHMQIKSCPRPIRITWQMQVCLAVSMLVAEIVADPTSFGPTKHQAFFTVNHCQSQEDPGKTAENTPRAKGTSKRKAEVSKGANLGCPW